MEEKSHAQILAEGKEASVKLAPKQRHTRRHCRCPYDIVWELLPYDAVAHCPRGLRDEVNGLPPSRMRRVLALHAGAVAAGDELRERHIWLLHRRTGADKEAIAHDIDHVRVHGIPGHPAHHRLHISIVVSSEDGRFCVDDIRDDELTLKVSLSSAGEFPWRYA